MEEWKKRDPLLVLEQKGLLSEKDIQKIKDEVEVEIKAACKFAEDSPYPEPEELMTDIFA